MDNLEYFNKSAKILQNLENCCDKGIDMSFTKEALKSLIQMMKSQNTIMEQLVKDNYDIELPKPDNSKIIPGMICYIPTLEQFAKIKTVNRKAGMCSLIILDTDEIKEVNMNQFNI